MYKISEKLKGCRVTCDKFIVNLAEATQDQLAHLYHLGHKGIEFVGKKPKNKPVDNFNNELNIDKDEQEIASE